MAIYSSILLASFFATGLAMNFSNVEDNAGKVQQFASMPQPLFPQASSEDSPPPGCDRTEPRDCNPRTYRCSDLTPFNLPLMLKAIPVPPSSQLTGFPLLMIA